MGLTAGALRSTLKCARWQQVFIVRRTVGRWRRIDNERGRLQVVAAVAVDASSLARRLDWRRRLVRVPVERVKLTAPVLLDAWRTELNTRSMCSMSL